LLAASAALNVLLALSRPEPRYFAVTSDLRIAEMAPAGGPEASPPALAEWAGNVVSRALSLNFLTFRRTLEEIRADFAPEGYAGLLASLEGGGHLEKIERERLSLSCLVGGTPVVTAGGAGAGPWRVEVPLVLSYESSSGVEASQRLLAEVEIRRARTADFPRGVAISRVVLAKAG
jgi:intracellular multiplication protein IcmL